MPTNDEFKKLVIESLKILLSNDAYLIKNNATEPIITGRLACIINNIAEERQLLTANLSVDVEYNLDCDNEDLRKRLHLNGNSLDEPVRPDIIIHERGNSLKNKLVIEFKKSRSPKKNKDRDITKLKQFNNEYNYSLGCFIVLNTNKIRNLHEIKFLGTKLESKKYYRHSKYPGSLKEETLASLWARAPEKVLRLAIRGMLPPNRTRDRLLKRVIFK